MSPRGLLYWIVWIIAAATLISGLVQIVAPGFVLDLVAGQRTPTTQHFFGIIGMFMALFGAMLLHALRDPSRQTVAIFWSAVQKFGASAAVAIGVERHLFSLLALGIASFDFVSGILVISYWAKVRSSGNRDGETSYGRKQSHGAEPRLGPSFARPRRRRHAGGIPGRCGQGAL